MQIKKPRKKTSMNGNSDKPSKISNHTFFIKAPINMQKDAHGHIKFKIDISKLGIKNRLIKEKEMIENNFI